jgi:putative phosphoesterase
VSVVAALYDVHGNLPALDAVLADPAFARADTVVVGGDVAAGPLPAAVLDRLAGLDVPVRWVRGNADREVVAHFDRGDTDHSIYGPDAPAERADAFTAARIDAGHRDLMAGFEDVVREALVVCGHTHHQFALRAGGQQVVNAGSVGMPYEGRPGAFWLLVADAEPEPRRTEYDLETAGAALRASGFPDVDDLIRECQVEPVEAAFVARHFEDCAGT